MVDVLFDQPGEHVARASDAAAHVSAGDDDGRAKRQRSRAARRRSTCADKRRHGCRSANALRRICGRRPTRPSPSSRRWTFDRPRGRRLHMSDAPRGRQRGARVMPRVRDEAARDGAPRRRPTSARCIRMSRAISPDRCPECGMKLVPATSSPSTGHDTARAHDEHEHATCTHEHERHAHDAMPRHDTLTASSGKTTWSR